MTHDPYQTFQTVGAYPGLTNAFSSPFNTMQTSAINPMAAYNPAAANIGVPWGIPGAVGQQLGPQGYQANQGFSGVPNYGGISPLQLQIAAALAAQSAQLSGPSPFNYGWQNPLIGGGFQHPYASAGVQNPLLAAVLQNALQNPFVVQQVAAALGQQIGGQPYSQYGHPYQQPYQQIGPMGLGMGQQGSPFSAFNTPFGVPQLAPQSWVGQGIAGQLGQFGGGQGQVHPFHAQLAARALQTQGVTPWGAF